MISVINLLRMLITRLSNERTAAVTALSGSISNCCFSEKIWGTVFTSFCHQMSHNGICKGRGVIIPYNKASNYIFYVQKGHGSDGKQLSCLSMRQVSILGAISSETAQYKLCRAALCFRTLGKTQSPVLKCKRSLCIAALLGGTEKTAAAERYWDQNKEIVATSRGECPT